MTDKLPRARLTPAQRATKKLDSRKRTAVKLAAARDKAKADFERLDAEATAAERRYEHAKTDPDLPPAPAPRAPRQPRRGGAADAPAE